MVPTDIGGHSTSLVEFRSLRRGLPQMITVGRASGNA